METRTIKISLETATRWANGSDNELKELALQTYPELAKKQLPKSWEELGVISGYYIEPNSEISEYEVEPPLVNKHQNIFATKNQAKSALAMAKLSQVMAVYNGNWQADWSDFNQNKYCICFNGKLSIFIHGIKKHFLSFKTKELAEEFLTNFKEDIETYFNF